MVNLTIDNRPIEVPAGTKVIEAAERLGIIIPRFCYFKALGAVGACRVCAVKFLEGPVKGIQMSCMTNAMDGMVVSTTDPEAVDFRRQVIEWLMINHPHDCPVCDEGGHCLLQDMTVSGGHGRRRYTGQKAHLYRSGSRPPGPARDEPLHPLLPLCPLLSGIRRRQRSGRHGDRLQGLFRPFRIRSPGKPLCRQPHRSLPHRSLHRQTGPLQGPALGSGTGAVRLPALFAGLQRHARRPLPGGAPGRGPGKRGGERPVHLRSGPVRLFLRQPGGPAARGEGGWQAGSLGRGLRSGNRPAASHCRQVRQRSHRGPGLGPLFAGNPAGHAPALRK